MSADRQDDLRLASHPRYPVDVYGWDGGSVDIDIGGDSGGWSGCGHPSEISLSREDLVALLAALDAEVERHGEATGQHDDLVSPGCDDA